VIKTSHQARNLRNGTALALIALFAGAGIASAQTAAEATTQATPQPLPQAAAAQPAEEATTIVVVGTRAAQQNSISRKKNAKTATDSIVAEDVGKFPDKNVGEAISRIAGVALSRSDYGEGETISLRGSPSDQVNVEVDGLGMLDTSTTGGLQFGGSGRNKDFRDLPADLIKSVDVVKGSTAAMTEGGIGGAVLVNSRTALDFKKPYLSFRFDESENSLSRKFTPSYNLIATRKFLNDRLGLMANISQSNTQNDNNAIQNSNGATGMMRNWLKAGSGNVIGNAAVDLDGSADKTFTFNPDTLSGATIDTPFANSTETPTSLLTKSAAAQTKADCYAAFPLLTGNSAATAQRTNELMTCLNQWGDYVPSLIRYFVRQNTEVRQSIDLRADYKVNDDLNVFVRGVWNRRKVHDMQLTYNVGGINMNSSGQISVPANGSYPAYNGFAYQDVNGVRTAIPGSPYSIYDGVSLGDGTSAAIAAQRAAATANGVQGVAVNIVPGSAVFDANHHLLSATITDGAISTDEIMNVNDVRSSYFTTGFDFRHGPIKANFIAGHAESSYSRFDYRINPGLAYTYGAADLSVSDSGLWSVAFPSSLDNGDPTLYSITRPVTTTRSACTIKATDPCVAGQTGSYTPEQQPWTSYSYGFQMSPRLSESSEDTARFDMTYDFEDRIPFIQDIQVGFNLRKVVNNGWDGSGRTVQAENTHNNTTPFISDGNGGYVQNGYEPAIIIPRQTLRSTFRACDETMYGPTGGAAPAGALPCNYGYLANTDAGTAFQGVFTLKPADMENILGQVFMDPTNQFFNGYPNRGNLIEGWKQIDVAKLYNLLEEASQTPQYSAGGDPLAHYNFDCIKRCVASDGNVYDMLKRHSSEKTAAGYWMAEFEQNLPWGIVFNGNLGTRVVQTDVLGSGYITLASVRCKSLADCGPSTTNGNTTTYTAQANVAVSSSTTDWMPSYNYNLWFWDNKVVARYYAGRVISRPGINYLLPAGTCTFDERYDGAGTDDKCSKTFGNPALKPYISNNKNWSLEYYPNRDTQFSYAVFKNDIKSGSITTQTYNGVKLLEGTGAVDPVTGEDKSQGLYSYTTYINGGPYIRRGEEFAFKTAFSFLPWRFQYFGLDGNYATIQTSTSVGGVRDPISGDVMAPANEPSYYGNLSLWYDDGRLTARLAYQARSESFNCISSCTVSTSANYPGDGYPGVRLPYNPGFPVYTAKTEYLDFKVNYKATENIELFVQATNILQQSKQTDQGSYNAYENGTPSITEVSFPGYRVTAGFTLRYQ